MVTTPLVFIRGLFRSQYHWGNFAELLQQRLPKKRMIMLDIPGSGEKCHLSSPTSITEMMLELRLQLGNFDKIDIIALSMGGMIGLKWAENFPYEVNNLICINTSVSSFSPFFQRLKPKNYFSILKALFSTSKERETIIYHMTSNKITNTQVIADWVALDENFPISKFNFVRQLYAASKFSVTKPKCKSLFISSLKDRLVDTKASQAMAKAWDLPLLINYQDGHDIPLDNPNWLIMHIVDQLSDS